MAVQYNVPWKLLIDGKAGGIRLSKRADVSASVIAKPGNDDVDLEIYMDPPSAFCAPSAM